MNLNSLNIVALTGAGLSVESGIPPYRGSNGSYTQLQVKYGLPIEQIITPSIFEENPSLFWNYWKEFTSRISKSKPNEAHLTLAMLKKECKSFTEITQNVDGLSIQASDDANHVIELHGSARTYRCTGCGEISTSCEPQVSSTSCCKCKSHHGFIRPDVVMFGEGLDQSLLNRCETAVSQCHIMLIIGTALHFDYLIEMVMAARRRDAIIVFINPEPFEGIAYYDALYRVSSRLDVINIQETASVGLMRFLSMLNSNRLIPGSL